MEIGDLEPDGMAVDQLMGFFELDLVFGFFALLERAFERGFGFGFDNIRAAVGFVNQHLHGCWRDFYHPAADSVVIEVAMGA